MKIGHVLYKVSDLDAAVTQYRRNGFDVEYGRAKNPYNALAYFADGSYLELLARTGMPSWGKRILSVVGKRAFAARLTTWDEADEGWIGLALECDPGELDAAKRLLKDSGQGYFGGRSRRTDTRGRVLRFDGAMPDEMKIPFFGTCDTFLGREGLVHPNGIVGFKSVSFGTTEELIPLIERLCTDDRVELFVGDGVKDVEFEHARL
ncbi:MAG: VOC family protein [Actinomycetota bacterium]